MDPKNAIELRNVTKTFKVVVENKTKTGLFGKIQTETKDVRVLDGLTLNVAKGDVLGVIGRNGAGKSTFLSIIARIMEPDTGEIEYSGKIASILELGMGFHGDMSGRENIYLKGELYGFSKSQIDERIDNIIEYSGIRDFIDNPVRTYSSGMTGRLAFAIMVNVDSDIMLVDEILSVGDSAFEMKAREHFKKLSMSGKTIIFVSHQLGFIESFCNRAIWIEDGRIMMDGAPRNVCSAYENTVSESPDVVIDLASAGVADAQYKLALMYRDGIHVEKNVELYEYWMKLSSMQGHIKAQVEYGDILFSKNLIDEALYYYQNASNRGDNDAKIKVASLLAPHSDYIAALIDIFKQKASQGDAIVQFRCAELLLRTSWTNDDRNLAFQYYQKSAEKLYPNAIHQVGVMYRDGLGTNRELVKMEQYLVRGAESGFMPSIVLLYELYSQGKLIPRDDKKAFNMALLAAKLGNVAFMYKVAAMYAEGQGVDVDPNSSAKWYEVYNNSNLFWHQMWAADYLNCNGINTNTTVEQIYKNASESSNTWAVGNYISNLVSQKHNSESTIGNLRYLAEYNNLDAARRLANIYHDGVGVSKNYPEALKWFEVAANLGDTWCMLRAGEMYRDGKGIAPDYDLAVNRFMESSKQGNTAAMGAIISMYASGSIKDHEILDTALGMMSSQAKGGNIDAARRLGNLYYEGTGITKDYSEALKW